MALTVGDREVRPLTADEVLRMVAAGILSEDERVELLHGVLTAVSAKTPGHATVSMRLAGWLIRAAPAARYAVRIEAPLMVPDRTSLPEPDVAVVDAGLPADRHPAGALLVIEVAVSSLGIDTRIKPALYAAAGVPEYWVVDVPRRCAHVFSEPGDGRYTACTVVEPPAAVEPAAVEVAPLPVASLFDGL